MDALPPALQVLLGWQVVVLSKKRYGRAVPQGKSRDTECQKLEVGRQNDAIDRVNHAVASRNIGLNHIGIIDHD